jgi:Ca-activated chloride channel family protein
MQAHFQISPYRGLFLFAGFLLWIQLSPLVYGQGCADCTISGVLPSSAVSASEWWFTKEVNEVNVLFVAMRHGKFIGDLSQNDVVVLDDQKPPAVILGFRTEQGLPLRVGLVIDTSESLNSRFHFEQKGAGAFLHQAVRRDTDQAFVLGFSDKPLLAQDFSNDPELLSRGVQRLSIRGATALYDAVVAACHKLVVHPERDMVARVLVVLSDGQSNTGRASLEEAIDIAEQAQVVIYTISTNYQPVRDDYDPHDVEGSNNLRRLADQTGGLMVIPTSPKQVGQAFATIAHELRSRYAIAYRPADFKADGRYREITIRARWRGKKLKVRARRGYYAKLRNTESLVPNPRSGGVHPDRVDFGTN